MQNNILNDGDFVPKPDEQRTGGQGKTKVKSSDENENKDPKTAPGKSLKVFRLNVSQFELTKALYTSEIFSKTELTSSAKLFLWALCTHYNPNKETMFPAQQTVAKKLGISAKSAQRAVKELKTAGLIEYVTRGVNHYNFGTKFFEAVKMSLGMGQNVRNRMGQNVQQTNKHEKRNNNEISFNNFSKGKYSSYKGKGTWEEAPVKRMTPNAEETRALILEREKIRDEGFNPYEYNKKDAYSWLKSIPAFWLHKSHLAKTLIQKYQFKEFLNIQPACHSENTKDSPEVCLNTLETEERRV